MITNEPTVLTPETSQIQLDEDYFINIDQGEFLLIRAGQDARKPASKFEHPNISAKIKTLHEFKHCRKGGSKFWTAKPGIDFYLVIPKHEITILPEKGYSYVKGLINGVKVTFNVSGGGCGTWTDRIFDKASISVGHSKRDMKKLAEVAVKQDVHVKEMDESEEHHWNELYIGKDAKQDLVDKYKTGQPVKIALLNGYHFTRNDDRIGTVESIRFCQKTQWRKATPEEQAERGAVKIGNVVYTNRIQKLVARHYAIKPSQVDWTRTFELNQEAIKEAI